MNLRTALKRRIWTLEEIHSCPEFGDDVGWFYGLLRHEGKLRIVEILPGFGYTVEWPWRPHMAWWTLRDIYYAPIAKAKYVGKGDPSRSRLNGDDFITLEELFAEIHPWSELKHKGES